MLVLGVMADPGLPEWLARHLAEDLGEALKGAPGLRGGPATQWDVQVSQQKLSLDGDGQIPLISRAAGLRAANGWDLVIYITDLPRTHDHQRLLTESDGSVGAALVSLPALGWFRAKDRLRTEVVRVVTYLTAHTGTGTSTDRAASDRNSPVSDEAWDTPEPGKVVGALLRSGRLAAGRDGQDCCRCDGQCGGLLPALLFVGLCSTPATTISMLRIRLRPLLSLDRRHAGIRYGTVSGPLPDRYDLRNS